MNSSQTGVRYDAYEFPLGELTEKQLSDREACEAVYARANRAWGKYAARKRLPKNKSKLKKLLRSGLNVELREWVWFEVSGARKLSEQQQPNYFESLYQEAELDMETPVNKQIELDLPRSFVKHAWIQGEEGQTCLRQVLQAISIRNPSVGYCQGLNYVAAMLLLTQRKSAERAFWILTCLVEKRLCPRTYEAGLEGCHIDMRTLGSLLQRRRPALGRHLGVAGCDVSLFAADWFISLMSTSLPAESCARVWDALLGEGAKVLHRVGLVLLLTQEQKLMGIDNAGDAMVLVKTAAAAMHGHEALMDSAFNGVGGLPWSRVRSLREKHGRDVKQMLERRRQSLVSSTSSKAKPATGGQGSKGL